MFVRLCVCGGGGRQRDNAVCLSVCVHACVCFAKEILSELFFDLCVNVSIFVENRGSHSTG